MMRVREPEPRLEPLLAAIRACRLCVERPAGPPLPHEPRPVLQVSKSARLAIFSQAPGARVHESGRPFTDASGDRLRDWLGIGPDIFYDDTKVAIVPMGFCFPGYDANGSDLPPRKECAPAWRASLMAAMPKIKVAVLVGGYAQRWHLNRAGSLTQTVRQWRDYAPAFFPTPHPSWRNNGWLKENPWFETELLPELRRAVSAALGE